MVWSALQNTLYFLAASLNSCKETSPSLNNCKKTFYQVSTLSGLRQAWLLQSIKWSSKKTMLCPS